MGGLGANLAIPDPVLDLFTGNRKGFAAIHAANVPRAPGHLITGPVAFGRRRACAADDDGPADGVASITAQPSGVAPMIRAGPANSMTGDDAMFVRNGGRAGTRTSAVFILHV